MTSQGSRWSPRQTANAPKITAAAVTARPFHSSRWIAMRVSDVSGGVVTMSASTARAPGVPARASASPTRTAARTTVSAGPNHCVDGSLTSALNVIWPAGR